MHRNFRFTTLALAVGAVVVLNATIRGQDQAGVGFGSLTLRLTVPERQFLVLEPIPMTLRLENRTGRSVLGHSVLEFAAGRTTILIQPEGSKPYPVAQLSVTPEFVGVAPRVIRPGDSREITEVLAVNLDEVLPRPGQYRVQVSVAGVDPAEMVRSNVVSISLREPDGLEQAAQDFVRSTGSARYLLTGLSKEPLYAQLEEVAAAFGNTIYGAYAMLRLGEINASRGNEQMARAYLSKVASMRDFPLAPRAVEELTKLSGK
jgi:hypothetical protein